RRPAAPPPGPVPADTARRRDRPPFGARTQTAQKNPSAPAAHVRRQRASIMSIVSEAWLDTPQATKPVELSILVPVYNERPALPMLYARLRTVLDELAVSYEILLVDDGSSDGSSELLAEL